MIGFSVAAISSSASGHDSLCAMASDTVEHDFEWCMCPLITKVRKDERSLSRNDSVPDSATGENPTRKERNDKP